MIQPFPSASLLDVTSSFYSTKEKGHYYYMYV